MSFLSSGGSFFTTFSVLTDDADNAAAGLAAAAMVWQNLDLVLVLLVALEALLQVLQKMLLQMLLLLFLAF